MIPELHATDEVYRRIIADPANQGQLPPAMLTFGNLSGYGWGFLEGPWSMTALFPQKGTVLGIEHPLRVHEQFWIRRLTPFEDTLRHRNHEFAVTGRYWRGLAWRRSWGRRVRLVIIDPDVFEEPEMQVPW